jgi:protein TonB
LAFAGSLVAHVAVATALAGLGYARNTAQPPSPEALVAFETLELPRPATPPEPPKAVEPRPIERPRAPKTPLVARAPEPSKPQLTAAPEPPAAPAVIPVATVDAPTASSSISVPVAAAHAAPAIHGAIGAPARAVMPGTLRHGPALVDRSRPAGLADTARWSCPFPREAEVEGIETAKAVLRVEIDAAGQPQNVTVTGDPGHGFGREARRCAMRRRWLSKLDRSGAPTADAVTVVVRFERS